MAKYTMNGANAKTSKAPNDLLPDVKIEQVPITDLRRATRRVRKPSNRQVARIEASIKESGFVVPVLLGKDNEILDGHSRAEAAGKLGLNTVPAIRVCHLDNQQQRALRIALNKIQELGS